MNHGWIPWLLQTSDALFPTGAYAHSLGLEEFVRLGVVSDAATLKRFVIEQVIPAQREQELPYLRFAWRAARAGDLAELRRVDLEVDAWKLASELREASAQVGARRLKALLRISDAPFLIAFDRLVSDRVCRGHHLVVCGLQSAIVGVPLDVALLTAFYQAIAAICAASMKLIRIGQDACQMILREACGHAEKAVAHSLAVERRAAGWFNPALEIASMRHARADERLFIS